MSDEASGSTPNSAWETAAESLDESGRAGSSGSESRPAPTTVAVEVRPPYLVTVGSGLLARSASFVAERQVAVISDSHVGPLYSSTVCDSLTAAGKQVLPVELPAGEGSKSLSALEELVRVFAANGFRRDCAILALGGGVVSDLAGFAAASYLRGVAYYVCPTSLLAMVDASVGGKTGVNLPEGKNLVGAFWQPRAVLADVETLASLPERQFREGAVELFKHGLLADPELLRAPDDTGFAPGGDPVSLQEYVARSVSVKARVVEQDERESGSRAHLNLGHTLAHALEAASDHRVSHGEAVAYGLVYAALLGKGRGWHDFTTHALRLLRWLRPKRLPVRSYDELLPYMLRDKKNTSSAQRFVLLREETTPAVAADVSEQEQRRAWDRLLEVTA